MAETNAEILARAYADALEQATAVALLHEINWQVVKVSEHASGQDVAVKPRALRDLAVAFGIVTNYRAGRALALALTDDAGPDGQDQAE